jgi:hypothetical protein
MGIILLCAYASAGMCLRSLCLVMSLYVKIYTDLYMHVSICMYVHMYIGLRVYLYSNRVFCRKINYTRD